MPMPALSDPPTPDVREAMNAAAKPATEPASARRAQNFEALADTLSFDLRNFPTRNGSHKGVQHRAVQLTTYDGDDSGYFTTLNIDNIAAADYTGPKAYPKSEIEIRLLRYEGERDFSIFREVTGFTSLALDHDKASGLWQVTTASGKMRETGIFNPDETTTAHMSSEQLQEHFTLWLHKNGGALTGDFIDTVKSVQDKPYSELPALEPLPEYPLEYKALPPRFER